MGRRPKKITEPCKICGDRANGMNFGAISCLACTAFFRLSIVTGRSYECGHGGNCVFGKERRNCCRHCRLKKCRQVGMIDGMVKKRPQMANKIKKKDENGGKSAALSVKNEQEILADLEKILQNGRKKNAENLEKFLKFDGNFKMVKNCADIWRHDKNLLDEIFKKLPFFGQLDAIDQGHLLRHVQMACIFTVCSYYSQKDGLDHLVTSDGIAPHIFYQQSMQNPKLAEMADEIYVRLQQIFGRHALSSEEFIILLVLVIANFTSSGLSSNGRAIIYEVASKYTSLLVRTLQKRYGIWPAISRHMELMDLVSAVAEMVAKQQLLDVSRDLFLLTFTDEDEQGGKGGGEENGGGNTSREVQNGSNILTRGGGGEENYCAGNSFRMDENGQNANDWLNLSMIKNDGGFMGGIIEGENLFTTWLTL